MSWLSTLFNGNSTVNNAANNLLSTGATATGIGTTDASTASTFFNNLLSGNTSVLAPQISAIQKQGSQGLQTMSQFGNRSGGTNSEAQQSQDNTRSQVNNLIQGLTGSAASSLGSLGSSLLNTGTNATSSGANLMMQNKSLFSNLLTTVGAGFGKAAGTAAFS